jgi:hypothetical protein
MVYALLILGRMVLPTILCCVAFIFVMSLILLGIWDALPCAEWSDAFLSCHLETGLWFSYSGHPGSIMWFVIGRIRGDGTGLWFSYSGHPGSIMWFVTGWIRGDGDSCRQQSPEFLLVNLGILRASFYKHCCWWWPSDSRSMRVGCSHGSEAPLVLVSPYLKMLDSDLMVSCLLLIQQASTQRSNWCTLDQWPLVKSATRSIGLWRLILALLILQRISYLF